MNLGRHGCSQSLVISSYDVFQIFCQKSGQDEIKRMLDFPPPKLQPYYFCAAMTYLSRSCPLLDFATYVSGTDSCNGVLNHLPAAPATTMPSGQPHLPFHLVPSSPFLLSLRSRPLVRACSARVTPACHSHTCSSTDSAHPSRQSDWHLDLHLRRRRRRRRRWWWWWVSLSSAQARSVAPATKWVR